MKVASTPASRSPLTVILTTVAIITFTLSITMLALYVKLPNADMMKSSRKTMYHDHIKLYPSSTVLTYFPLFINDLFFEYYEKYMSLDTLNITLEAHDLVLLYGKKNDTDSRPEFDEMTWEVVGMAFIELDSSRNLASFTSIIYNHDKKLETSLSDFITKAWELVRDHYQLKKYSVELVAEYFRKDFAQLVFGAMEAGHFRYFCPCGNVGSIGAPEAEAIIIDRALNLMQGNPGYLRDLNEMLENLQLNVKFRKDKPNLCMYRPDNWNHNSLSNFMLNALHALK